MTRKKRRTIDKRRISRDCWDLDWAFYKWLSDRLPVYLKEGGSVVDLTYYKFKDYNGEEKTQEEIIKRMIVLVNYLLSDYLAWTDEYDKAHDELMYLWTTVIRAMWW